MNSDPRLGCSCNAGSIKTKKKAGKRLRAFQGVDFLDLEREGRLQGVLGSANEGPKVFSKALKN